MSKAMPQQRHNAQKAPGRRLRREEKIAVCRETISFFRELLDHNRYGPILADSVPKTRMFHHPDALPPFQEKVDIAKEASGDASSADVNKLAVEDSTTTPSTPPTMKPLATPTPRIFAGDTLDVAIRLKATENLNPLILNMASIFKPGGGWQNGSSAQEEQIFYRSTYDLPMTDHFKLDPGRKWRYPMPVTGGIYTPNVLVFRGNELNGYPIWEYEDCVFFNFVAVAALKNPVIVDGKFTDEGRDITGEKIRGILRIAGLTGHRDLLLGALGCGAYGNPKREVAMLFKEVFGEEEFQGWFDHLDFAILDTRQEGNCALFQEVLLG
ncbi:hypothetical protein HK097_007572 [Rhizophlyctis rosea]|uniref:Microbial-type PARG catalytic domain-containing protein n=1 Tax=Rhizophlyctis rosea TaxID=64517 RepID=A0AAD5SNB9_9FUNG|nr:hypothetical protein HK097_007572 [Rhizophlyctis rosea]